MARRRRRLSKEAKEAISKRMTAYWRKRRRSPKDVLTESVGQKVARDLPWRLTVVAQNGDGHVKKTVHHADGWDSLVGKMLQSIYEGPEDGFEVRLERL